MIYVYTQADREPLRPNEEVSAFRYQTFYSLMRSEMSSTSSYDNTRFANCGTYNHDP